VDTPARENRCGYIWCFDPAKLVKAVTDMAARNRSGKSGETAWRAQGERYVQRLLEDERLRANLLGAYSSARSAYGRLGNGKGPTHALFQDPKLQRELLNAANALRDASLRLGGNAPRPRRRRRRLGRPLLIALVGAGLAIALSPDLRSKILDLLFGSEEAFDYTSTTAPASPAPANVAGA
jgi:hypothetical protein